MTKLLIRTSMNTRSAIIAALLFCFLILCCKEKAMSNPMVSDQKSAQILGKKVVDPGIYVETAKPGLCGSIGEENGIITVGGIPTGILASNWITKFNSVDDPNGKIAEIHQSLGGGESRASTSPEVNKKKHSILRNNGELPVSPYSRFQPLGIKGFGN